MLIPKLLMHGERVRLVEADGDERRYACRRTGIAVPCGDPVVALVGGQNAVALKLAGARTVRIKAVANTTPTYPQVRLELPDIATDSSAVAFFLCRLTIITSMQRSTIAMVRS